MASYKQDITQIVRVLINDSDRSVYSDARIHEVLIVAAQLLNQDYSFTDVYNVNLSAGTISPDPTISSDNNYINLVSLRTALFILWSELKTSSSSSVRIQDGPSSIDLTSGFKSLKDLYDGLLLLYGDSIMNYKMGSVGVGILTPYPLYY